MGMRIKDRVQTGDLFSYGLLAEIGGRVDEDATSVVLHHHRWPGAAVVRVVRGAAAARAADSRHAHRRAAAQHGEYCFHFLIPAGWPPPGGRAGALAMALVISIQAMRNSKMTFWSNVCSRSVRLPLVFS